jgi:hypothetical protein
MTEMYPINIWVNEERYDKLVRVGLADVTRDMLAGMRVLQLKCNEDQKEKLLQLYPMAKYDSATTKSIELLPPEAKDQMFDLVIKKRSLDIISAFMKSSSRARGRRPS